MTRLDIDREQMAAFVDGLFRHADGGTFATLRAFRDDTDGFWLPQDWPVVRLNGDGLDELLEAAGRFAFACANADVPVVFAPPIATFKSSQGAAEKDVANGLTVSVECDRHPTQARTRLTAVLGPSTIVLASGGEWINPNTGEVQQKLHLHWRLSRPTREFHDHVKLKEARRMATALIGSDPSGVPLVHPMRWAGSWHRKSQPRLARILECNPGVEIDLDAAFDKLNAARADDGAKSSTPPGDRVGEEPRGDTAELITKILNADEYHDPIAKLAMRYRIAGMAPAQVVSTLRGIMLAVDPARRDLKDGKLYKDRWRCRFDDIPRAVSTAQTKIEIKTPSGWPEPAPLLAQKLEAAPPFPVSFLPGPLSDFACDIADRMQCPVDLLAIPMIIESATLIGKEFRMAPKAWDDWTERPCLWGGLILPSGAMKSPGFQKALGLHWLQADFHKQHEQEIEEYKAKMTAAEFAEKSWKEACKRASTAGQKMPERPQNAEAPVPPRLRRLLTADATQEALVDLIEQNPRGLMLFRDELSGWFATFNQYRPGADRQFYLECHAGGSFLKDRKLGSAQISDLYLNICGGVQPAIVQSVLSGGDLDGMTARFSLLVWPDQFDQFAYVDRQPNSTAAHKTEGAMKKLLDLDAEAFWGPAKPGVVRAFRFDDRAQEIFIEWYTKTQLRLIRIRNESPSFSPHLSKYAGLFARLTIVHHLIRYILGEASSPTLVDRTTASAVENFIDEYLEPHACRIYAHLGSNPVLEGARRIARWLIDSPAIDNFAAREIRRREWAGLTTQDEVNLALDYLENVAGWVRCTTDLPGPRGGRASSKYLVNPLIRRALKPMPNQNATVGFSAARETT